MLDLMHSRENPKCVSINSKIRLLCPKTKFVSQTVIETATAIAILWFNKGHATFGHVLEELHILPSKDLVAFSGFRDERRIKRMSDHLTAETRAHCHCGVKKRMPGRVCSQGS